MAGLGAPEIGLILLAVFLLVGHKKLPDATRALGRSLRIVRTELRAPAGGGPGGPGGSA